MTTPLTFCVLFVNYLLVTTDKFIDGPCQSKDRDRVSPLVIFEKYY